MNVPLTEYALSEDRDDAITSYYEQDGYAYLVRTVTADIHSIKNMRNEYKNLEFRPDDIWLDLGSCIGGFAVPCSNVCKQVICVEPSSANITFLQENLYFNSDNAMKYVVLPFAVTSLESKEVDFHLHQETNTQYHTIMSKRKRRTTKVRNINLDALIFAFRPNCIKMDIEGAEFDVLFSCYDLLYDIDELYMEYHKNFLGRGKAEKEKKFEETLELLKSCFSTVEYHGKSQPTFHCSNR